MTQNVKSKFVFVPLTHFLVSDSGVVSGNSMNAKNNLENQTLSLISSGLTKAVASSRCVVAAVAGAGESSISVWVRGEVIKFCPLKISSIAKPNPSLLKSLEH